MGGPTGDARYDRPVSSTHRLLRIHGGRLVVEERREELEAQLDAASTEGFEVVESFAIDDNVYLLLRKTR